MTTLLTKQNIAKGIKEIEDKNFPGTIDLLASDKVEENKFKLTDEMKTKLDNINFNHKKVQVDLTLGNQLKRRFYHNFYL